MSGGDRSGIPGPEGPEPARRTLDRRDLELAETLARWGDNRFVDPLLGLVAPGLGDALGAVFGAYVVLLAARRGAPKVLLARMLVNLGVDVLAGLVPVVGDVGDFFFRAHRRNLRLLRERSSGTGAALEATAKDHAVVLGAALFLLAALAAPIVLLVIGLRALGG